MSQSLRDNQTPTLVYHRVQRVESAKNRLQFQKWNISVRREAEVRQLDNPWRQGP